MPVLIKEFEAVAEPSVKAPSEATAGEGDRNRPALETDDIRAALAMLRQRTLRSWAH